MNIQYAGDAGDLFKFDLVRHMMKNVPGLERFTFIPMLTEERVRTTKKKGARRDPGGAGAPRSAGSTNLALMEQLGRLREIESDRDYFSGIESYFGQEEILVDILHRDTFSHENRANYFDQLFSRFPARSLILLDPDTGLEVKNPTERHLLYEEVKKIHYRMDEWSALMIYQHIPRVKRDVYFRKRCEELTGITGAQPLSVSDGRIAFFILAKGPALRRTLCSLISEYSERYPGLVTGLCG